MIQNRFFLLAPYLSLFLASFLWASSFVALKIAFRHYDPMVVLFARMVVGSACFLLISRRLNFYLIKKEDIKAVIIMVLFEPCLYFFVEAKALKLTSASQAGMITALLPLMVSVTAFLVLKKRLDIKTVMGLGVSVFGACWLKCWGSCFQRRPESALGKSV